MSRPFRRDPAENPRAAPRWRNLRVPHPRRAATTPADHLAASGVSAEERARRSSTPGDLDVLPTRGPPVAGPERGTCTRRCTRSPTPRSPRRMPCGCAKSWPRVRLRSGEVLRSIDRSGSGGQHGRAFVRGGDLRDRVPRRAVSRSAPGTHNRPVISRHRLTVANDRRSLSRLALTNQRRLSPACSHSTPSLARYSSHRTSLSQIAHVGSLRVDEHRPLKFRRLRSSRHDV